MPTFKVRVEYVDHIAHYAEVVIEASTVEEALAQVQREDEAGEIDFREGGTLDCDPATYRAVPIPPTPEEAALADMTAEYLGEG
jgi:hypothetical protein